MKNFHTTPPIDKAWKDAMAAALVFLENSSEETLEDFLFKWSVFPVLVREEWAEQREWVKKFDAYMEALRRGENPESPFK